MTRTNTKLTIVDQAEAEISDAHKAAAPMVQRLATHRDRLDLAVKELESERFELISRRDHLRRQAEAVDQGFSIHIDDIDQTLRMYEGGLNSVPMPKTVD